jgi:uncharacterized protein YcfL
MVDDKILSSSDSSLTHSDLQELFISEVENKFIVLYGVLYQFIWMNRCAVEAPLNDFLLP